MMPRVRFTHSDDGVSIAFCILGKGPPIVLMPAILFSHLEKTWELPKFREGLEELGERWTVVRYDNRGCGLSQREVSDYSLEAHLLDLEAVVDELGLDTFALNAPLLAGPVGIAFAARHPERVTHLILQSTLARSSDVGAAPTQAMLGLLQTDWQLFTETAARYVFQWADEALAKQAAPLLRECVTQEALVGLLQAAIDFDVSSLLPQVKCPTMVIHNRQFPIELAMARDLASRIPDARLAAVDNVESSVAAIGEFLSQSEEPAAARGRGPGPTTVARAATGSFDPARLTTREIEILRLVAGGKSNRQIAEELVISTNTVDRHVSHILAKIGAANRAEATAYAEKQRLL